MRTRPVGDHDARPAAPAAAEPDHRRARPARTPSVTAACSSSRKSIARRPFRKGSTAGRPDRPPRPGRPPAVCLPAQPSAGSKSSDLQLASRTTRTAVRSDGHGTPPPHARAAVAARRRARARRRPLDAARRRRAAGGREALQRAAGRARRDRAQRAERPAEAARRAGARRRPRPTRSARRGSSTSSPRAGRELAGALRLLADWGARSAGDDEPLRHAALRQRRSRRAGGARTASRWSTTPPRGDVVHV